MKARSVARELALFVLFQQEKKGKPLQWDQPSLQAVVVETVRTLTEWAEEHIEAIGHEITNLTQALVDYEYRHPVNENIPMELPTEPVPIPTTQEMVEKLETLVQAVDAVQQALYVPEFKALAEREDVLNYCAMLVKRVANHKSEIDEVINAASDEWRVDRIQKMDLALLRLAVAELRYADDVDAATVVDETLELAKRFTTEESRKFIHGILGAVAASSQEVTENV